MSTKRTHHSFRLTSGKRGCGVFLLWAAAAIALPAQTLTTLHSFDDTDGWEPAAGLIKGTNGNLYGATTRGGTDNAGTIFEITPSGTLTTLLNFDKTDGNEDFGNLVLGTDGNFYGTTELGGAHSDGTIFKITPSGTLTTLHSFDSTDGAQPRAGLVQGTNGNFYGTTEFGGKGASCTGNCGTLFEITPNGTLTTLYNFCSITGCKDGCYPNGNLIVGANGNLYGTTLQCGTTQYDGTVFEITPSGKLTTLFSFDGKDGASPYGALVLATNGNFYGTTTGGGAKDDGTVFEITPSGTLTTLYSFCAETKCTDGKTPYGGLIQGTNGNFYGTTQAGGANNYGSIFEVTISGTLSILHSFDSTDGAQPYAGLVQGTNGDLYGTTFFGGANNDNDGTVFRLIP
jgi:uncharacterized repeat protein (TIGR03803 family)